LTISHARFFVDYYNYNLVFKNACGGEKINKSGEGKERIRPLDKKKEERPGGRPSLYAISMII
jgi:hypothetical protein